MIEGPEAGGHLGFSRKQLEEKMDYDMEISEILKLVRAYEKKRKGKYPLQSAAGSVIRRGQSMGLCLERI